MPKTQTEFPGYTRVNTVMEIFRKPVEEALAKFREEQARESESEEMRMIAGEEGSSPKTKKQGKVAPKWDSTLKPMSAFAMKQKHPHLRPVVIDGALRRGEVATMNMPPKSGKTWGVIGMAIAVATGQPWLGLPTTRGRVLLIDNELHPETLSDRVQIVCDLMGVDFETLEVDLLCLRGKGITIFASDREIEQGQVTFDSLAIERDEYVLVSVDALYRILPDKVSENENTGMTKVYNKADYFAAKWNSAILFVHHTSKGAQAHKSVTDTGSGAGSIARAADIHIALRPHKNEGMFVFESENRSFSKRQEPFTIKLSLPLWVRSDEAAEKKRTVTEAKAEKLRDDDILREKIYDFISLRCLMDGRIQQKDLKSHGFCGVGRLQRMLRELIDNNRIVEDRKWSNERQQEEVFYVLKSEETDSFEAES